MHFEFYCKFQIPALNTIGGVAETRTVLGGVMDVPHFVVGCGHNEGARSTTMFFKKQPL